MHAVIPFAMAALSLFAMSTCIDANPAAAFMFLLAATVLWGPAGKSPQSLHFRKTIHPLELAIHSLSIRVRKCWSQE